MKSFRFPAPLLALILTVLAGCASGSGTQPSGQDGGGSGVLSLVNLLNGRWQAEGSDLTLDITSAGTNTSGQVFNLFASTTGSLGDRNVSERAVLHLEWEGGDVEVSVIPRGAAVTALSPEVTRVSEAELRAACTFTMVPTGDGYSGQTQGGETCARAIQGAVGQWRIQVSRDTLQLSSASGGAGQQQLTFRKAGN